MPDVELPLGVLMVLAALIPVAIIYGLVMVGKVGGLGYLTAAFVGGGVAQVFPGMVGPLPYLLPAGPVDLGWGLIGAVLMMLLFRRLGWT